MNKHLTEDTMPAPMNNIIDFLNKWQTVKVPFLKGNRTIRQIVLSEIATALIRQTLRPSAAVDCFTVAGMEHEPNFLLLIQVDDCYKNYYSLPTSCDFQLQEDVIDCLYEKTFKRLNLDGFLTSIYGSTNIVCFLYLPENPGEEAPELINRAYHITEEFRNDIYQNMCERVTIGMSNQCHSYAGFPIAYQEALETLYRRLLLDRENIPFLQNTTGESAQPLRNILLPLIQSIHNADRQLFIAGLADIIEHYMTMGGTPEQIKLNIVQLVKELENYIASLGVDHNLISQKAQETNRLIYHSKDVADIYQAIDTYFSFFTNEVQKLNSGIDYKFRQTVDNYLAEHYADSIDLTKMSQLCNYSAIHFGRLFKKNYGQNFSQYLTKYRLEKSIRLLRETQLPVKTIAMKTGFNSVSYFCTTFKNNLGLSPQKYREQHHYDNSISL